MTTQRTQPRYRLDSRIATGGMGEVWRATDTVLDREVAVKVLKPEYADDPAFRSRFAAEARHAAALHHHNVASVFDFGELPAEDGSGNPRPYLVMELVPGRPLSALLRDGEPMAPDRAADVVAQAADGIASAHALGIVHRDVKPGNLLVTPSGLVKITDFGIARAGDAAGLTQTGQVLGTPAYLSPEQAEGRRATAASDIYSLGVVLYECLAGARPFTGETPVGTALAHLRDEPPPLPDTVPPQLRQVVATALAKDPQQRFVSMAAFAAALRGGPVEAGTVAAGAAVPPSGADAAPTADEADPADHPGTRLLTAAPVAGPDGRGRGAGRAPGWWPWAATAAAVALVVVLTSVLFGDARPASQQDGAPAAATESSERPDEGAAGDTSTPRFISLDEARFVGMPKDEAKKALEELGLKPKEQKVANPGGQVPDTVAAVSPTRRLQPDDEVTLSVWDEPEPAPEDEAAPDDTGDEDEKDDKEHPGKGKAKGKDEGKDDQ